MSIPWSPGVEYKISPATAYDSGILIGFDPSSYDRQRFLEEKPDMDPDSQGVRLFFTAICVAQLSHCKWSEEIIEDVNSDFPKDQIAVFVGQVAGGMKSKNWRLFIVTPNQQEGSTLTPVNP